MTKSKYAYVWSIFKGDRYIPGILISAWSIKRTNTKYDLVCMVTHDVSEKARKILRKNSIKVIEVPYIQGTTKFKTGRQQELYENWLNISYTKWNCLNLTQYKKIFLLDADVVVTQNIDYIFDKYKRPAGTFYNPWSYVKRSSIKNFYKYKKVIKPDLIKKALSKGGFVMIATSVLIKPNKKYFEKFKEMIKEQKQVEIYTKNNYSGADEQSIAYFMSVYNKGPQLSWDQLPQCFQYIPWHRNECCDNKSISYKKRRTRICDKIKVVHFFGEFLVWEVDFNKSEFKDLDIFLALIIDFLKKGNVTLKELNLKYPKSIERKINYESNKYFKVFPNEFKLKN